MGDLLVFPQGKRKSKRPTGLAGNASAEILLFTGVRYERCADVTSALPDIVASDDTFSPDGLPPGARPRKRRAT